MTDPNHAITRDQAARNTMPDTAKPRQHGPMPRTILRPVIELYTLARVARDDRTPRRATAVVTLALLYILSPVDVLPDVITLLGWTDDALVGLAGRHVAYTLFDGPQSVVADHRATARSQVTMLTALGLGSIDVLTGLGVWFLVAT